MSVKHINRNGMIGLSIDIADVRSVTYGASHSYADLSRTSDITVEDPDLPYESVAFVEIYDKDVFILTVWCSCHYEDGDSDFHDMPYPKITILPCDAYHEDHGFDDHVFGDYEWYSLVENLVVEVVNEIRQSK